VPLFIYLIPLPNAILNAEKPKALSATAERAGRLAG